ncbi:MAG: flippase-like domain-containing protein [Candidatus Obscuribacterales bacterium]|nr:flippase-like domain-containing protein [Candidatus Obscuribacterales bacterium]
MVTANLETPEKTADSVHVNAAPVSFPRKAMSRASEFRNRLSPATKIKLKILLSVLMFASLFLFGKVDLNKAQEIAAKANMGILAATAILFLFSFVVTARRWQLLTRALGFNKPLFELVKLYFVGVFFNLFLPSTVGGDVSRCYYLTKGTDLHKEGFYSVLADRASGLAVLFLTATVGLLLSPDAASLPWQLKWPVFAGTFGTFVVLPMLPFLSRTMLGERNWISRQLNDSAATVFWKDKALIPISLVWSFLSQIVIVLCHIGVGISLGLDIPLWYYFVFYPSVAVLGFVTPSFNGIGIREWAYTYFLLLVGVDRAYALTYALMWLGLTTFSSVFGGLVYILSHMQPPPKNMEEGASF